MIQAMINSIQKEYLMEDQSQKFGYNVQRFIDETNPFGNNSVEYMGHNLSFTEQDYDEFLMDVYSYSTSILSELQQRFPNRSQEWAGFKLVVSNNLSSKDIDIILPLLIQDYNDTFPNIIKLIQLVYCIPFSSVECECGF
ncbi:hypothetical protein RIR_jg26632.t1 [Rhizophagus irregularis DAOM 181602=DAOM 197198]|nr:hypothetical protein RIR_jg26632.t1 [Rhizophagus irregularis DAOM 181602=DAOM 197198]